MSVLALEQFVGHIKTVAPDSCAARLGLQPGDEVLTVNGQPVQDVIDVQFYAAEDQVTIAFRRAGQTQATTAPRYANEALGLEFTHPTFDIDIRRCNNLCPFCFVLQTAPRMRRALYIKDDDYRYSFLFGHYVTLTNLAAYDWERIEKQHLSPLYISVHATDLANRRACLANPTAPDILPQLRWLAERHIEMHTQLVLTPGLNDGPWLERSINDLAQLYPAVQSVSIVPVGLTRHHKYGHRPYTQAEARQILKTIKHWQKQFLAQWGVRFVYPTDEWFLFTEQPIPAKAYYDDLALEENGLGMVRNFLDDWRKVKRELQGMAAQAAPRPLATRRATLATATLFAPVLAQAAQEFNTLAATHLRVQPILNERLGHTITVAGLLMGQDVLQQLQGQALGEFVVLPRVMFDHPQGISLDDISPLQLAQTLQCPIFLADAMGDVLDAFTGANPLKVNPTDTALSVEAMRAGGWAVEKYL